jgi:hypothetical protein
VGPACQHRRLLLPPAGDYAGVTPEPAVTPLFIPLYCLSNSSPCPRLQIALDLLSISPLVSLLHAARLPQNSSPESRTAATVRAQFRHNQVTPSPTFSTPLILLTMRTSLTPSLICSCSDSTRTSSTEAHRRPAHLQSTPSSYSASNRRRRPSFRARRVSLINVVASPPSRTRWKLAGARRPAATSPEIAGTPSPRGELPSSSLWSVRSRSKH